MALRHTAVIGIGGSGKWVITYLKKMLEDINNGQFPSEVALLALDLAGDETPPVQIAVMGEGHKTDYKLDFGQQSRHFYQFSDYWARPIHNIKNAPNSSDFPSIRKWLKKDDADLYIISPSDLASTHGAGQRRQTSRVSLFLNLEKSDNPQKRLRDAIGQAAQGLPAGESLTFHIVCSVAGGTGCGTFIDVASLVQKIALEQLAGGQINLLGYFVLPKSFEAVADNREIIPLMDGNCYAALRELQRFMHFQPIPIQYPDAIGTVANQTRLFDVCYLVDGGRPAGGAGEDLSNVSPRLGVLPGIADFIFHHIAYPYPADYTQVQTHINQNLLQHRPQGATIYSSFGIYQYIFDAQGVIDTFAHKLALDVLNCFLEPSPQGDVEVAEEAHDFMRAEGSAVFDQSINTYLSGTVAPNVTEQTLFSILRLGENRDQPSPVLNIEDQVQTHIPVFRPTPSETVKRQTESLIERFLGSPNDVLGTGVLTYYAVLNWYRDEHARLFRDRIRGKILGMLRERQGRGGLRHALLFLRRLAGYDERVPGRPGQPERVQHIEGEYERFMALMRNTYTTQFDVPKAQARNAAARAEADMLKEESGSAQKRYLRAKQNEFNFDRQELVFETVMRVADDRRSICADLRDQVESWLHTFEEGHRVMREAHTDLVEVRNSQAAIKMRKYVSLPGDAFEGRLYDLLVGGQQPLAQESSILQRLARVDIQDILSEFGWRCQDGMVECTLPADYAPWEELRSNPLRWNYQFVRTLLGRGYFQQIVSITVMDVLALSGTTSNDVCETLLRNSAPMATLNLANHPPTRNWDTVYLQTQADLPGASLAQGVNNALANLNPNTPLNRHVISRYQAYHLIGMEAFATLGNIEQVYRDRLRIDQNTGQHTSPPLHNFLAEKRAARHEQLLPEVLGSDEQVRNLSLDVVHLLEDEQAVEIFTLAMLNGLIKTRFNVQENRSEYICEQEKGGQRQEHPLGENIVRCVHTLTADQRGIRKALYDAALKKEQDEIDRNGLKVYGEWLLEQVNKAPYLQVSPQDVDPESDLKRVMKIILWQRAQRRLEAAKQQQP